ncbi:CHAT domain-containing protein [Fulvivirgaceae bacterium PWU5]|uniref:CHAT domain-containing protein n=1 Tax=Dawidia cretensis TaxID=2782350 RepID=A0AAP2GSU7_9BACT|nr:CHAT domain-containing protein [Dawidia cretensis]MBT1707578.1 CHAT domain-containing protein [Dawidia cretensis]
MKFSCLLTLLLAVAGKLTAQTLPASIDQYIQNADYTGALTLADATLARTTDAPTRVLLQARKAEALIRLGRFDEASALLTAVIPAATTPTLAGVVQTQSGLLYLNQGRNDQALEALQLAITRLEEAGRANSLEAAQALSHLGNLYRATGKYTQAEEQLTVALAYRQKLLPANHELIAASYNDLGLVFSNTDADKALDYYEKALAIYQNLHGAEHPKIAIARTNTGFLYRRLELYGDAVNNFEAALKINEKVYPGPHPAKAFVLFNLGETYRRIGDTKAALAFYQRARAMYTESYGPRHPELARVLNALGNLSLAARDYHGALAYCQQALQANTASFHYTDVYRDPPLRDFYDGNVLLYSLLSKAQALEARYYGRTLKFPDLTAALQTLQRCDTLIDKLRQQTASETDKISLGATANEVYADGVRIAFEATDVALHKHTYRELAFYFAEKSKSAVLQEAITDANAKAFAGIPATLLEEEKDLKAAIAQCAQKLAQKPDATEEKRLREKLFTLNRNYAAYTRRLEQQFPDYFNLRFNSTAPATRQLQARLDAHTALLSYFIDEKNSHLYVFTLTQKKFRITDHTLTKDFDRYITGLRNSLLFNNEETYRLTASHLSELLIPDHQLAGIKHLVILPTGRLSSVPFETLLTPGKTAVTGQGGYPAYPYLLKRYSIRYEFSAGVILQRPAPQPPSASPSIFLCAPVAFPVADNLNDLPGTEAEVSAIAQRFQARNLGNQVYLHEQAGEGRVKSGSLDTYTYLHFATHGIVDEASPELSRIFLQPGAGEDGHLFAGEVYTLNLRASLVTLSACQTGLGKLSKGEGVIGLSRALVYAGAKNILVSYWSVADVSTAVLMEQFYGRLLEAPTGVFAETLRETKLGMIKDGKYAAPYYWAPFVLIGF